MRPGGKQLSTGAVCTVAFVQAAPVAAALRHKSAHLERKSDLQVVLAAADPDSKLRSNELPEPAGHSPVAVLWPDV